MSVGVEAARPGPDTRWLVLPVAVLAPLLGAAAVVSPIAAVTGAVAVLFVTLAFYDLAAGVALFAAIIFFETLPGASGAGLGAVKVAGIVLVLAALRRSGTPLLAREHPLLAYLAVLLGAWAFASMLWAQDVSRAAADALRFGLGITLLFIVFAAVQQPRHVHWLVWGYISGAAAAALVGIVGTSSADESRLTGGLGDPNFLAAMLVSALVLAVFELGWTRRPAQRWLLWGCVVLFTVSLYLTQSRGGLVALAASFAAGLVFGGPVRRYFVVLGTLVVAVGFAYYAMFASSFAVERLTNPGRGTGRADVWSIATEVISDHPLVGVGAGNFPVVARQYATEPENLPFVRLVVDTPKVAHNTYLGTFADLGLVGLLAFAFVIVAALVFAGRSVRVFARARNVELELLSRAVLIALIGMLTAFVFLSGQYEKQLWLLFGLAIALHALARKRTRAGMHA